MSKRFLVVIWGQALLGCSTEPVETDGQGMGRRALGDAEMVDVEAVDCDRFNSYMASLATLTANCLGTVDPRFYELDAAGFLVPTFGTCQDGDRGKLSSIRQLLSLQHRPALLPSAKACMAGRYAQAREKFDEAGAPMCPQWEFVRTENPITENVIKRVEQQLPQLPSNDPLPPGILDGDRPALRTINMYAVAFAEPPKTGQAQAALAADESPSGSSQSCGDAANCAKLCASPFPGFFVDFTETPDGRKGILTDPDAWLETTVFANSQEDPYLRPLYYHPMSYYGGPPGVPFGAPHRSIPCGVDPFGTALCIAEMCSYWTGSSHKKTRLQVQCNDYDNLDTCVSFCGPPISPPAPHLPPLQPL